MTGKDKPSEGADGVMRGLVAFDQALRDQQLAQAPKGAEIAEPGAGLHAFLETVAKQFTSYTPQGFPSAEASPSGATGPKEAPDKIEPGSISAQAIEAGKADEGHHAGPKAENGRKPDAPKHR